MRYGSNTPGDLNGASPIIKSYPAHLKIGSDLLPAGTPVRICTLRDIEPFGAIKACVMWKLKVANLRDTVPFCPLEAAGGNLEVKSAFAHTIQTEFQQNSAHFFCARCGKNVADTHISNPYMKACHPRK
jgi:hypothetical protein